MIEIQIDGQKYQVEEGKNLLHVGLSLGLDIPYFCWHPAMGSVGACRLCAVKQFQDDDGDESDGKIVMSCMTAVEDGLHVSIEDPEAVEFRKSVTEWLMVNHPHDCPVCDEGGECHLQDMTLMTGHCYREYRFRKRTHLNQYLGPFIDHEMNRCIQCYRCIRFYRDTAGGGDLQAFGAHDHVYFGRRADGVLQSEFSGNLVEICPTGVFTDKTLKKHYTRKWDLQTAPSVCVHCAVGCNTIPGERYGTLRRIRNRFNAEVNGYFLCDRGRFGYEFVNGQTRIRKPLLRRTGNESLQVAEGDSLESRLRELVGKDAPLFGVGSPRASIEANFALRRLVGEDGFSPGLSSKEQVLLSEILTILKRGPAKPISVAELEKADAVLVLGEDLTNTAARLDLAIHSSVRRQPIKTIASARGIPEWHDHGVRQAIQEARGPLFVATPASVKLDSIATRTFRGAPDDIARLGFAVAASLGSGVEPTDLDSDLEQLAREIAGALRNADHPVVISGTSLGSESVIHAAANVAAALHRPDRPAGICMVAPECNSLGAAMMGGRSCESILEEVGARGGTLIVLENDLMSRCDANIVTECVDRSGGLLSVDHTENETTKLADVVLPSGTFAESTGTLVSFEGRAQRFYRVLDPDPDIPESWQGLGALLQIRQGQHSAWDTIDDVHAAIEAELPVFVGIRTMAPSPDFRAVGQRIPRQPHRYSGRTAIHANEQIHEPRPPSDPDSPLSFSMEGYRGQPPAALVREYWSPGWDSVQSLNKFQQEVGGPLRGGTPGYRLFDTPGEGGWKPFEDVPPAFERRPNQWLAAPIYHLFGSERLSTLSPAVKELVPERYVALNGRDASELGISEADQVEVRRDGDRFHAKARISSSIPRGVLGLPILEGSRFEAPFWVELRPTEDGHE